MATATGFGCSELELGRENACNKNGYSYLFGCSELELKEFKHRQCLTTIDRDDNTIDILSQVETQIHKFKHSDRSILNTLIVSMP